MKRKRILALFLAAVSCLLLAVSASAANTVNRKATDFKDYDRTAWYAEAVSAAVDNGLLYGKSSTIIDPNGDMTRAEMAAIINRSFGCYKTADISQYKDVSKSKWYYKDVALAVQMGTYNGRSSSTMAPDAPISRQEAMTVVARALELDYDSYSKTDLSAFSDRSEISNWALPYVRAMVGADYIHGRGKVHAPLDNITRAEFAQIFYNIIGTYIVSKGTYDKDIKGSVLIRTDDVTFKNMTVDGDLIIGCGAADGKIVLDNVTVKGRFLVWGGGTKAVYCNNGTQMPEVVVARVDDAVKVIYDEGKSWNKNMVARILENAKYTGADNYPELADIKLFEAAVEKRQTKQRLPARTPAQKALKRICSKTPTSEIEQQVTHLLGRLAEQPERITQPEKQLPPIHSTTQIELDDVLNTQPLDEDAARSLICKLAQEQYDTIGNKEYETERLRRLFTAFECTAELNAELLQSAVSAVLVTCQTVRLQLKNGQIIGKDDLV